MLSIFKRRRRTIEPVNADLRVHYINPDADTIDAGLGISEERLAELDRILHKACEPGKDGRVTTLQAIEEMSFHVKHPNELAYLCFSFGALMNEAESYNEFLRIATGNHQ